MASANPRGPVVCVPVTLDAFVLVESLFASDRKSRIAPLTLPDYTGLGKGSFQRTDILDHVDTHATTPIQVNTRVTDVAGTGQVRQERLGVYLHWIMPKGFRTGIAATESASKEKGAQNKRRMANGLPTNEDGGASAEAPEFRPVPDRWFVFRHIHNAKRNGRKEIDGATVAAFVIESNVLRKTEDFPVDADIETQAAPFLDSSLPAHDQDDIWIGRRQDLAGWAEADPEATPSTNDKPQTNGIHEVLDDGLRYHSPLTVVSASNPMFADYQIHNSNVFSLHDDLAEYEYANLAYFVFGYYSRSAQDPFTCDRPSDLKEQDVPSHRAILKSCMMELQQSSDDATSKWLDDLAHTTRLICHGALYNVIWDRASAPNVPAEKIAADLSAQHPVALGVDTLDALEGYLEVTAEASESSLMHSISTLLKSQHENVHAQRLNEKELIKRQFSPADGGTQWHLSKDTSAPDSSSSGTAAPVGGDTPIPRPSLAQRPTAVEVSLIHQLNVIQASYDACVRQRDLLQFLLFCEWFKHRAEPDEEEQFGGGEAQKKLLEAVKVKVECLTRDLRKIGDPKLGRLTGGKLGMLQERLDRIRDHPNLKSQLKPGIGSSFYTRKDPSLVLLGLESPWPSSFTGENLKVRLSSQLSLTHEAAQKPSIPMEWLSNCSLVGRDTMSLPSLLENVAEPMGGETYFERNGFRQDARDWLTTWQMLLERSKCAPRALQNTLVDLLTEWLFLSSDNYKRLNVSNWPSYLGPGQKEDVTGKSPSDLNWKTQAWFPLFVEWEAQYFHIPFSKWSIRTENDGNVLYDVDEQLVHSKGIRNDTRMVSGRSMILPQVAQILKAHVELLFKQAQPKSLNIDEKEEAEIIRALDDIPFLSAKLEGFGDHLLTYVHGTHVAPHVDGPDMNGQVLSAGHDPQDPFSPDVMALLKGASAEVSPYGRYLDFQHHRRDGRDQAFSPFKPATHGQAKLTKLNIIDKFGQVVPALTMLEGQDTGMLLPYTSKTLSCQANPQEGGYFANTVVQDAEGQCQFFQLPPAINQDARLNACFVLEDAKSQEEELHHKTISSPKQTASWRPCNEWENPIWGWLIINFRDGGLQIFQRDGVFLAEVLLRNDRVYWQPTGAEPVPTGEDTDSEDNNDEGLQAEEPPKSAFSSQFTSFLTKLSSREYLETLMATITEGLEYLHHAPNSYAEDLPAIFGRPLALVNMGWSLELGTQPLTDQSTPLISDGAPKPDSILDYEFELKIGDKDSFNDGLIGYFSQAEPAVLSEGTIRTDVSLSSPALDFGILTTDFNETTPLDKAGSPSDDLVCVSKNPKIRPYYIDPLNATPETYSHLQNKQYHVFGAIVDPFSIITGYAAIIPPKQLQLPPWAIEKALKQISPFLTIGPVLIPGDVPDTQLLRSATATSADAKHEEHDPPTIPAHIPGNGEWVWLQPFTSEPQGGATEYRELAVSDQSTKFEPLEGPHTAVSGFLQLKTQPVAPMEGGPTDVPAAMFGELFGDAGLVLDLRGTGSAGGTPGEMVNLIIEIQRRWGTEGGGQFNNPQFFMTLDIPAIEDGSAKTSRRVYLDQPELVAYKRPASDYMIALNIRDQQTSLRFPLKLQIPVDKDRSDILSAELSTYALPSKVTVGQPFTGELVIRDRSGNVCKDYDDRDFISIEGFATTPQIDYGDCKYQLQLPPLSQSVNPVSIFLDETLVDSPTMIQTMPSIDMTRCVVKGSGLCSGLQNQMAQVSVLVRNGKNEVVTNADVKVEISNVNSSDTPLTPVVKSAGKSSIGNKDKASGGVSWFSTSFPRPPAGDYRVNVAINSSPARGSPFAICSTTDAVNFDTTRLAFELAVHSAKQEVAIKFLDSLGRRWREKIKLVHSAQLRCRAAPSGVAGHGATAGDRSRGQAPSSSGAEEKLYNLGPNEGDGVCRGALALPAGSRWRAAFELALGEETVVEFQIPGVLLVDRAGRIEVEWDRRRTGKRREKYGDVQALEERDGMVKGILGWTEWAAK